MKAWKAGGVEARIRGEHGGDDSCARQIGELVIGAARNHFEIALGSVGEVCAELDLVALDGADARQDELRRVGAMLAVLSR